MWGYELPILFLFISKSAHQDNLKMLEIELLNITTLCQWELNIAEDSALDENAFTLLASGACSCPLEVAEKCMAELDGTRGQQGNVRVTKLLARLMTFQITYAIET
ncbi:hypothetical protein ROZALSC1DRAFT_21235 [Rozella allomycis CSF55]|uniref:Uncharacterized protein n=1 Tax=Rozella allomycis (strain CSF55) TaxID=988480 RepID=A0A4P9YLR5_ROZAC|nr:hypothetical protein ROZALSC1DRAFT_21235 [Rozella allomycis CSF55]